MTDNGELEVCKELAGGQEVSRCHTMGESEGIRLTTAALKTEEKSLEVLKRDVPPKNCFLKSTSHKILTCNVRLLFYF